MCFHVILLTGKENVISREKGVCRPYHPGVDQQSGTPTSKYEGDSVFGKKVRYGAEYIGLRGGGRGEERKGEQERWGAHSVDHLVIDYGQLVPRLADVCLQGRKVLALHEGGVVLGLDPVLHRELDVALLLCGGMASQDERSG